MSAHIDTSNHDYDCILSRLRAGSQRDDSACVASTLRLRCVFSVSLDQPLLEGTQEAIQIVHHVLVKTEAMLDPQIVRSLILLTPSGYETPWFASLSLIKFLQVKAVQRDDDDVESTLRAAVFWIQCFLRQTVATWWDEDCKRISSSSFLPNNSNNNNKAAVQPSWPQPRQGERMSSRTSRDWILDLLCAIVSPLQNGNRQGLPAPLDKQCVALLEIIPLIVSICKEKDAKLSTFCLDLIIQRQLLEDRGCVIAWIRLVWELRYALRNKDWNYVLNIVGEYALDKCRLIVELPNLVANTLPLWEHFRCHGKQRLVRRCVQMITKILARATTNLVVFSQIEDTMQTILLKYPRMVQQQWMMDVEAVLGRRKRPREEAGPLDVVHNCVLLLVARLAPESDMVSRLVSEAFGCNQTDVFYHQKESWTRLLRNIQSTEPMTSILRGSHCNQLQSSLKMVQLFQSAAYIGRGALSTQSDATTFLSSVSLFVYEILFLYDEAANTSNHDTLLPRANTWIQLALATFARKPHEPVEDFVVIIAIVTVFCEIRSLRPHLLNRLIEVTRQQGFADEDLKCVCVTILAVLVRTSGSTVCKSVELDPAELNDVTSLFIYELSWQTFADLADVCRHIPSLKSRLLECAHQRLRLGVRVNAESMKIIIFGLCMVVNCAEWLKHQHRAVQVLSALIVNCRPPLPIRIRSWMFQYLKEFAEDQVLCDRLLDFLLRASLARLVQFFVYTSEDNIQFELSRAFVQLEEQEGSADIRFKQKEDIVGLIEFVLLIVHRRSEDHDERRRILREWKQFFILVVEHSSQVVRISDGHRKYPKIPDRVHFSGEDENCLHAVVLYCIGVILLQTIGVERLSDFPNIRTSLQLLQPDLNAASDDSNDDAFLDVVIAPGENHCLEKRGYIPVAPAALCDVAVELLAGPRWNSISIAGTSQDDESDSLRLIRVFSFIMVAKDCFKCSDGDFKYSTDVVAQSDRGLACAAAEALSALSIPAFEESLRKNADIGETDILITAAFHLCAFIRDGPPKGRCPSSSLFALEAMYEAFCEENAGMRLVGYLELQRLGSSVSPMTVCGLPINSVYDIDVFARRMKLQVLTAMRASIASFGKEGKRNSPSTDDRNPAHIGIFLLKMMNMMGRDVRYGLDGQSGGLTPEVVLAFLTCIEACADLLLTDVESYVDRKASEFAIQACRSAARYLEDGICSYDLVQAETLKKAINLPLITLPALRRCVVRVCLMRGIKIESKAGRKRQNLAARSLMQCLDILKRKITSAADLLWDEMAGGGHVDSKAGEGQTEQDFDRIGSPCDPKGRITDVERKTNRPLILASEKSWILAFSASLLSMDQNWEESLVVMQMCAVFFPSVLASTSWLVLRYNELREFLDSLSLLFGPGTTQLAGASLSTYQGPADCSSSLTMSLPGPAKSRLSSLVERIAFALHRAIKVVMISIQNASRLERTEERSLARVEALSCLVAWLDSRSNPQNVDFGIGAQTWITAESRNAQTTGKDCTFIAEEPVRRKIPRIIRRLDDLESSLEKLRQVLAEVKPGSEKSDVVNEMNSFVTLALKETESRISIEGLVHGKLDEWQEQRRECNLYLTAAGDKEDFGKRTIDSASKRSSVKRGRVIRSRNILVDKWLQKDRETGEGASVCDDGFSDLEDFLVEG